MTNSEGCPLAIHMCSKENEWGGFIKMKSSEYKVEFPIFITDQPVILDSNFTHPFAKQNDIIFPIADSMMRNLLEKDIISKSVLSKKDLEEIRDPISDNARYILVFNANKCLNKRKIRLEFIKKTQDRLQEIQTLKRANEEQEITSAVEEIFASYKTGHFFEWQITEGRLEFWLNQARIEQHEQLDGYYLLNTNVEKKLMKAHEIVKVYQELAKMKHTFGSLNIQPFLPLHINRPTEELVQAKFFLKMLSYYIRWHVDKKLENYFSAFDGVQWTFPDAIEKLKSIRTQSIKMGDICIEQLKNALDNDQQKILSALGVTLITKLAKSKS
jgi:hypothetical protein